MSVEEDDLDGLSQDPTPGGEGPDETPFHSDDPRRGTRQLFAGPLEAGLSSGPSVRAGEHICAVCRGPQEALQIIIPYLRAGLEQDERCLCVGHPPLDENKVIAALNQSVPELAAHLKEGRLIAATPEEWFLRQGRWDGKALQQVWRHESRQARRAGCSALRAVIFADWTDERVRQEHLAAEPLLEAIAAKKRLLILCIYDLERLGPAGLIQAVQSHSRTYFCNSHGWECLESTRERRGAQRLQRLMEVVSRQSRELRESRDFYLKLFDEFPNPIWRCTPDGACNYVNQSLTNFTGLPPDRILGNGWPGLIHPEDRAAYETAFRAALAKPSAFELEYRIQHADGTHHWIMDCGRPYIDLAGRYSGFIGACFDLTPRKLAEEALRANEERLRQALKLDAIGRLAGGIAHDFNNLMTIVIGYAHVILSQTAAQDPRRPNAEAILRAGERAAELTRQLLAFGRRQILHPRVLDLNALLLEIQPMLRPLVGEAIGLRLLPARDLGRVKADPGQIQQVLLNLVANAADAMPRGGQLTIETANVRLGEEDAQQHRGVTPGEYVQMTVTDTGCGMDKAVLDRMFEPFFTTKPLGTGTGLGLCTAYGIIRQSGGHIWVQSEVGKGSSFRVCLPRETVAPAEAPLAQPPAVARGQECILVVEDDPDVLELVRETLQSSGYIVLAAQGPQAALERASAEPRRIDLLLTDVVMPAMSGPELAARLTTLRPGLKVLYMSGYPAGAVEAHGVLPEGMLFVQKPLAPDDLARKIRDVLEAKTETSGPSGQ